MSSLPFSIVDVFSTTPYKGNPLAIVDNTTDALSDTQMKLIARQFNLSETTFFLNPRDPTAHFALRSFLPDGKEVFGAGHNILGAWWYLAAEGKLNLKKPDRLRDDGTEEFVFRQELGGKVSAVTILRGKNSSGQDELSVSVRQAPPKAHAEHPSSATLAQSAGLSEGDIGFEAAKGGVLKPQVMSTSTTRHLMVPVRSVEALNRVAVQRDGLLGQLVLVDEQAYGVYFFTPVGERGNNRYQARFFSPGMAGEDPATGSAAGPLSRYLHQRGDLEVMGGQGRITVNQGLMTGRECVIEVILSVSGEGDVEDVEVDVVGGGARVMTGDICVPDCSLAF
ncbi:hypothetical protein ACO1O0_007134 [Amphichorda felina]